MFPFDFFYCNFLYVLLVSLRTHKLDTSTIVFHFAMSIYGKDSYIELLLTSLLKKLYSSSLPMPCPTIFLIGKLELKSHYWGNVTLDVLSIKKKKNATVGCPSWGTFVPKTFKGQEF